MEYVWMTLGLLSVVLGLLDMLGATMGTRGGLISRGIVKRLWTIGVLIHETFGGKKFLYVYGIFVNLVPVALWIGMLLVGWGVFFYGAPGAVIAQSKNEDLSDFISFLQYSFSTLSGLGRGLYKPGNHPGWVVVSLVAALIGTFVISFSISFLIPLIQASANKRELGRRLALLGKNPVKVINHYAQSDEGIDALKDEISALLDLTVVCHEKHETYPTLHFFHSDKRQSAMSLNFVVLDEALTLIRHLLPDLYEEIQWRQEPLGKIMTSMLENLEEVYILEGEPPSGDISSWATMDRIEEELKVDIEGGDREFGLGDEVCERRAMLGTLLRNTGWSWEDVYWEQEEEPGT